jgi:GrpB-like predicted nucleotidyltransferase (UPF0157 family)
MPAPIELTDYDASWPQKFVTEREALLPVLGRYLAGPIEHIGSTAVPGLRAKPIIDIMAGVQSLDASRGAIEALVVLGYLYWPYKAEVEHWFCKPSPDHRTHHLHLVPFGSALWRNQLAFRDRLRNDPAVRAEYAALKDTLAARFRNDREAYTEAKGELVRRVVALELERARS